MGVEILTGHAPAVLAGLPEKHFSVCVTSPPYWSLRAYNTEPQVWPDAETPPCAGEHEWGEEATAAHQNAHRNQDFNERWGNAVGQKKQETSQPAIRHMGVFCTRCHAWRGELGQEPTVELYVAHLVSVFDGVKRVLRDDATLWINLSGSFFNDPGGQNGTSGNVSAKAIEANGQAGRQERTKRVPAGYWLKPLDWVDVPGLFARAMQASGWLWRSDMALCKVAPLPESVQGWRWERCKVKIAEGKSPARNFKPELGASVKVGQLPPAQWADCPGCSRCLPNDGLVLRRGNGRPTRAWERLLIFAKRPNYFWDSEAAGATNGD